MLSAYENLEKQAVNIMRCSTHVKAKLGKHPHITAKSPVDVIAGQFLVTEFK